MIKKLFEKKSLVFALILNITERFKSKEKKSLIMLSKCNMHVVYNKFQLVVVDDGR